MAFFNGHNHTMYSNLRLLDCINKPKDLIDRAIQLGLSGIAITDHEALCSHMEVNKYAKFFQQYEPGFTIALGNEIYLTETRDKSQQYYHFILIAKNARGHRALRELSSKAWINSYFDRGMERVPVLKSELAEVMKEYKGDVIATTACIGGELPQLLLDKATRLRTGIESDSIHYRLHSFVNWCIEVFGKDDFYIEVAPGGSPEQIDANRMLYTIARQYGLKAIPATDSHYLRKDLRFAHKAYLTSKPGEREVDQFYEYAYLMDEAEARELLKLSFPDNFRLYDDPEDWNVVDWLFENTEIERKSIEFYDLTRPQQIPTVSVDPPAPFAWWGNNNSYADDFSEDGCYHTLGSLFTSKEPQERQWINDVWNALETKIGFWGEHEEYVRRLEIEADVIKYIGEKLNTCLFAYFNTFKHYIDLFWECGSIVGPGRGSSTGFLSNYLLGITQLDPIKWNLPWWRLTLINY